MFQTCKVKSIKLMFVFYINYLYNSLHTKNKISNKNNLSMRWMVKNVYNYGTQLWWWYASIASRQVLRFVWMHSNAVNQFEFKMYHFYVLKCIAPSQIHRYVLKQQKQTYLDIGICTHRNESGVNYFETLNTSDRCYDFENISTEIFFDSKCSYLISLHNCECILCKN